MAIFKTNFLRVDSDFTQSKIFYIALQGKYLSSRRPKNILELLPVPNLKNLTTLKNCGYGLKMAQIKKNLPFHF